MPSRLVCPVTVDQSHLAMAGPSHAGGMTEGWGPVQSSGPWLRFDRTMAFTPYRCCGPGADGGEPLEAIDEPQPAIAPVAHAAIATAVKERGIMSL